MRLVPPHSSQELANHTASPFGADEDWKTKQQLSPKAAARWLCPHRSASTIQLNEAVLNWLRYSRSGILSVKRLTAWTSLILSRVP